MTSVAVIFIFAKAMTAETDTVSSISEITAKTAIVSEAAAHSRATEVAAPKAATMEAFASVENGPRSAAVPVVGIAKPRARAIAVAAAVSLLRIEVSPYSLIHAVRRCARRGPILLKRVLEVWQGRITNRQ